jgi:hypothetical protein
MTLKNLKLLCQKKIRVIEDSLELMYQYLDDRKNSGDWHGVEDAASDIRDKIAYTEALAWVLLHIESDVAPEAGFEPTTK